MAVVHAVCGHRYIQSAYTKVAAVGRRRKGGGAALGPATSFMVSFVLALNRVNVVAGVCTSAYDATELLFSTCTVRCRRILVGT